MKRGLHFRYIVTFCLLVIAVLLINASLLLYLTYRDRFGDAAALRPAPMLAPAYNIHEDFVMGSLTADAFSQRLALTICPPLSPFSTASFC